VGRGGAAAMAAARPLTRLLGLGATRVADHEVPGFGWTVLGNQFRVGAPVH
jgi:hypothetical protein